MASPSSNTFSVGFCTGLVRALGALSLAANSRLPAYAPFTVRTPGFVASLSCSGLDLFFAGPPELKSFLFLILFYPLSLLSCENLMGFHLFYSYLCYCSWKIPLHKDTT